MTDFCKKNQFSWGTCFLWVEYEPSLETWYSIIGWNLVSKESESFFDSWCLSSCWEQKFLLDLANFVFVIFCCLRLDPLNFSFKLLWTLRFERNIVFNGESAVLTPQTSELLKGTLLWVWAKENMKKQNTRQYSNPRPFDHDVHSLLMCYNHCTAWMELWVARNLVTTWSTLLILLVPVFNSTSLKCKSNYVTGEADAIPSCPTSCSLPRKIKRK